MNSILAVRLGAMGDILHALPAVASLKKSFPEKRIFWVVARKWMELLEGNPNIDELVPFDREGARSVCENVAALAGHSARDRDRFSGVDSIGDGRPIGQA